jgi:osmoprotectant transport system substrate-binding protein
MTPRGVISSALALLTLFATACGRGNPSLIIGSQNGTEQSIVGEIVAQHLESRLGFRVNRRPGIGGTLLAYQALQSGEINIYPEYTGIIVTEILKENPSSVPEQVFERAKGEMARISQADLIGPLGVNNSFVAAIRASDPHTANVSTLSQAGQIADGWKVGYSYDFQQQSDTVPALTQYHLPMEIPMRAMDTAALFKSMEDGQSTMILARATDGQLRSKDWKVLDDDRKLFTTQQLCLVVRQDVLRAEPRLEGVLSELSGKFTNAKMRELNAEVDIDHKTVADVAKGFLASLK